MKAGRLLVPDGVRPEIKVVPDTTNCRSAENHFDYSKRLSDLNSKMAAHSNDSRVFGEIAEILLEAGAVQEAKPFVQRAEDLEPGSVQVGIALAQLEIAGGEVSPENLEYVQEISDRTNNHRVRVYLADLFWHSGQFDKAGNTIAKIVPARLDAKAACIAGKIAGSAGQWSACIDFYRCALEADPMYAVGIIIQHDSANVSMGLVETGRQVEIADLLAKQTVANPDLSYMVACYSSEQLDLTKSRRRERMDRGLPSCICTTMVKSGSATVSQIIRDGFSLVDQASSLGDQVAILPWLQDFIRGGSIYNTHLHPKPYNIESLLEAGVSRVLVHVRDPRQAILSNVQSIDLHPNPESHFVARTHDLTSMTLTERVDFSIQWNWQNAVDWIAGWLEASELIDVRFTTFEEMVTEPDNFLSHLLQNYGGEPELFDRSAALSRSEGRDYRFRKGLTDEWRHSFSSEQTAHVNDTMPRHIAKHFGWAI
jgi:tetratricopeptide (TPR) repeat protein